MKQTLLHNKILMLAAALGLAAVPTKAMAHQVQTNYFIDGRAETAKSIELKTTFSNGQPLKGAKVSVYAPDQPFRVRATGVTDNQGRFTFAPDAAIDGEWEVNIQREGHQDILTVPVTEEGIDVDLLANGGGVIDQGGSDFHYATSPWAAVGGVAVAAACLGFARTMGKKSAE